MFILDTVKFCHPKRKAVINTQEKVGCNRTDHFHIVQIKTLTIFQGLSKLCEHSTSQMLTLTHSRISLFFTVLYIVTKKVLYKSKYILCERFFKAAIDDSFAHSWHSLNQLHEVVT